MQKRTSKIFVFLLLSMFGVSPVMAESEAPKEITKEQTYTTTQEAQEQEVGFETEVTIDNKKYQLKEVKHELISSTPIMEEKTEEKVISSKVIPVEEAFQPEKEMQEDGISYNLVKTEQKEVILQTAYTQEVSGTTTYLEKVTPSETKQVKVKNQDTGLEEAVTCTLKNVEELPAVWKDTQIELTFQDYDADYYVFDGVEIPRNDTKPALKGHEDMVLKSAGIQDLENYKVLDVNWAGNPFEENGIQMRRAVASVQRLVPGYQANYEGSIEIPAKKGIVYTSTYQGTKKVASGKIQYEKKAIGTYLTIIEKQNYTKSILISLAILVIILFILLWIYKLRKEKKRVIIEKSNNYKTLGKEGYHNG